MYDNIIPMQADLQNNNRDYAMATVVKTSGSSIAKPGFKLLLVEGAILYGTLGSPSLDNVVLNEAEKAMALNQTRYLKIALDKDNKTADYSMNTTCGGMIDLFIEPYIHRRKLIVLTESNDDKLLASLKGLILYTGLDLETVNINIEDEAKKLFSEKHSNDFVLLLTKTEKEIKFISHFLEEKPAYLAIVSSKNRFNKDLDQVKKSHPELDPSGIKCPAGIDINAITINEIAISIVAEIVMQKNNLNIK
jgi:xanthine dehydrogenase accessory factor